MVVHVRSLTGQLGVASANQVQAFVNLRFCTERAADHRLIWLEETDEQWHELPERASATPPEVREIFRVFGRGWVEVML